MKDRQVISVLLLVVLPIVLGSTIYFQFRGYHSDLIPFHLRIRDFFPDWVKYNLPDGLWLFAFLSAISIIWSRDCQSSKMIWIILAMILSIVSEIFQYFEILPGTFDICDLIAYFLAMSLFLLANDNRVVIVKPNNSINHENK